jgi:hypothetical protein
MTPEELESRIAALELRDERRESEHKALIEKLFRLEEDHELYKRYTDARLAGVAVPAEAPPSSTVAVVEPVGEAAPHREAPQVIVDAEGREMLADSVDFIFQSMVSGRVNTEKAASLKRRVFELAGRAVTGD